MSSRINPFALPHLDSPLYSLFLHPVWKGFEPKLNLPQIERAKSIRARKTECVTNSVTCDRPSDEAEPSSTSKKSGIVRSHQQSCINRVARETKTAGTLAVVVGKSELILIHYFEYNNIYSSNYYS